jgi:feruloyl esterase
MHMKHALAFILSMLCVACSTPTKTPQTSLSSTQCSSLSGLHIDLTQLGLPTSGARVDTAQIEAEVAPYADPEGEHLLTTPARCLVIGQILPVTAGTPPIRFAVNLPLTGWNGRALQSGGGGMGGQLITATGNKASGRFDPNPLNVPYPITQGYVTFGSDNGHPPGIRDHAFTRSEEAIRNWGHEELKKTRDAALWVIQKAYGRKPDRVFFNGESAGGREALMVTQKYPYDYDGVIATSPVLNWNIIHLADNRTRNRLMDGWLDVQAIRLIAQRTRRSCDAADGLQDGVIAKYLACPNDVAELQCKPGASPPACLSAAQVASVQSQREAYA